MRPERFLHSPYYHLISNNLEHLRRRIDPDAPSEFPIFDDLKKLGVTDYIAFIHTFELNSIARHDRLWSTDAPDGFSDDMIAALLQDPEPSRGGGQDGRARPARRQHAHHLSRRRRRQARAERPDQARRRRYHPRRAGDGRHAQDRPCSPRRTDAQVYIETLNQFFDAIAAPFNRSGGEILSASSATASSPSIRASATRSPRRSPARRRWPPSSRRPRG